MDEAHLAAAVRYVSLNPVRARLVENPEEWRWSSAAAHLAGEDDPLVTVSPILERYGRFRDFLGGAHDDRERWRALRMSETSGRPLGSDQWLQVLEERTGRVPGYQKRGPKAASPSIASASFQPLLRATNRTQHLGTKISH